jgi:gluconolactonase
MRARAASPRNDGCGTRKSLGRSPDRKEAHMDAGGRITRRGVLAISASATSLAIAGKARLASAQPAVRIEQFAPELERIISVSEPIKELASGFGGDLAAGFATNLGPAEGPVWWKEGGYLLFSDIHNDRRMKYTPGQGVTVVKSPTNRANGLTRDPKGRLVACEGETRRVIREELDGSLTVVANSFQGRRLNRPNDVIVKSDGSMYFTDPFSFRDVPQQWDLTHAGVYRVSADLGTLTLLVDNFVFPNGLAFSPDESVLYVNDTQRRHIRAFDITPTGILAKATDRIFADLRGAERGVPDGMKVDIEGNVYCGGAGGLWIFDPQGKKLGIIVHGMPSTTNIAFGGDDWKTLYFTSWNRLHSVNVNIPGVPVPAQKR